MTKSQVIQRAAWLSLLLSVAAFAAGIYLARVFLCRPLGPLAFSAALLLCALAFVLFTARAIFQPSYLVGGGALLVALLAFCMWVIATAMTLPGCSGV
jgi:uncharacterized membrane protein YwaF